MHRLSNILNSFLNNNSIRIKQVQSFIDISDIEAEATKIYLEQGYTTNTPTSHLNTRITSRLIDFLRHHEARNRNENQLLRQASQRQALKNLGVLRDFVDARTGKNSRGEGRTENAGNASNRSKTEQPPYSQEFLEDFYKRTGNKNILVLLDKYYP